MANKHDIRIDRRKLHPWLDHKLGLLLKECAKQGIYLIITEGFRTVAQQNALYAKGRTKPGNIVTNAKGSSYSSQHMWGTAFDIALNYDVDGDGKVTDDTWNSKGFQKVAEIAKSSKVGLGWGGDWKSFPDTPHFYLKKWGSGTGELKATYGTPAKFKKTWTKKVKRKKGLLIWKDADKKESLKRVKNGQKVRVMYIKDWYARILLADGTTGYMNKKYLK